MAVLAGILFALGLAALLFAAVAGWPGTPDVSPTPSALVLVGLAAMSASWGLLLARSVRLAHQLTSASHRLDEWAMDLQRERARSDRPPEKEWDSVQVVLGDLFAALNRGTEHTDTEAARQAFEGLGTESHPELVTLESLLTDAERLCTAVYPDLHAATERHIEPHPPMEVDRSRVLAILVQIVATARQQAAHALEPRVRIEAGEWQAGLLRIRVHASGPLPGQVDPRAAGLTLAAASAETLGGSLSTESDANGCRLVLLLPLDEPDVRTDPTPMSHPARVP